MRKTAHHVKTMNFLSLQEAQELEIIEFKEETLLQENLKEPLEELGNIKHAMFSKGLLTFYGQIKRSNDYFALLLDFRSGEGSSVTHIFLKDLRTLLLTEPKAEKLQS